MNLRTELDLARLKIKAAGSLLQAAHNEFEQAEIALNTAIKSAFKGGLRALEPSQIAVSEHRRLHRPGKQAVIDGDPELRAFIEARIDALTFKEIEQAVAKEFPKERRVKKSAIHSWWTRNRRK